jgi:fructokinase
MAGGRELVVSFGEMLIDFVPTVAGVSLAEAPAFLKAPGGAPANVAIAVSRLGGEAAFVGKLGDDEFGRMLAAILRDNGVDAGGVVFDAGARTALAFVTLRADGEREFMFYRNPSADMLLTADELNVELIKRVSMAWLAPPADPGYPSRSVICGHTIEGGYDLSAHPFIEWFSILGSGILLALISRAALGCGACNFFLGIFLFTTSKATLFPVVAWSNSGVESSRGIQRFLGESGRPPLLVLVGSCCAF